MRSRASGERNSWLALASSERCAAISRSMRSAAWLKVWRDGGDLVLAFDGDAPVERALAPGLDAAAQAL